MGVMLLNKEAILNAKDTRQEVAEVPEWGGHVCIRAMSGAERDDFRAAIEGAETSLVGKFEAPLLALTLVDEEGNRLFPLMTSKLCVPNPRRFWTGLPKSHSV